MVGRQAWFAAEMTRRYAGHPDEHLTLKPVLPGDERLADLEDELTVDTVTLGPFGIKILKFAAS
jgi:hypothetical protein